MEALIAGARVELRRDITQGELQRDREIRLADHDASWPPEQIGYLWHWFLELSEWRDSSMGFGPLSHQEMECWARMMGIVVSPFEAVVLRKIDIEFRIFQDEKNNPQPKSMIAQLKAHADAYEAERKPKKVKK